MTEQSGSYGSHVSDDKTTTNKKQDLAVMEADNSLRIFSCYNMNKDDPAQRRSNTWFRL